MRRLPLNISRIQLGLFGLVALLALRVSVGWHFYKEGAKKLQSPNGFTSAPFLRSATGPWADSFHDMARQPHDWDRLLAVPLDEIELDEEQSKEISDWQKEHKEKLASEDPPISPHTTYAAYAEKVSDDWKHDLEGMLKKTKFPKIDRAALEEKYGESIQTFSEGLKKDFQALGKKSNPTTDDITALKEKTTKAVEVVTTTLNKDLDEIIDRFKLSEANQKAEKKQFDGYTEELTETWQKQLTKLINSSYSEISMESTEGTESETAAETEVKEEKAADAKTPQSETSEVEAGTPPEPEAEDSESTAPKAEDTKAETPEAEETTLEAAESETTKPDPVDVKVTLPEDEAYATLVKQWKEEAMELIDLTDPEKVAGKKYAEFRGYLLSYLAENEGGIRKYQHELWRLEQMKDTSAASDVPYQKARIAEKRSETSGMVAPWIAKVQSLEVAFHNEAGTALGTSEEPITVPVRTDKLSTIDKIVPYWHLIIGAGLVLGLFSRLCGVGAALFLAAVIATQPPWVAGSAETYYQVVEFCGCLVLATIPTGRFAGLDFFVHSLFSRCCTKT